VRSHGYYLNPAYRREFTIRTDRPSGATTELEKIEAGWGDWMIYGFAHRSLPKLCHWLIGDLDAFRSWRNSGGRRVFHRQNSDGTEFDVFRADAIPGFLFHKKWAA
jgi:hypothetical protein